MRIAIVGAGLAGLACAHELERLGLSAEIFEKRDRLGKMFTTMEIMMQFLHDQPSEDIFKFLREELNLPIYPANHITRIVLQSENHEASLEGILGYSTIRGTDERALEYQLARHIRSTIYYDANPDVQELSRQYDRVVVATGTGEWPKKHQHWTRTVGWWVRGANVKGDFDPGELHYFFRTSLAGTGYAMVAPFDERTAAVGIGIPDSSGEEAEHYWQQFRAEMNGRWETEVEQFKLENYEIGAVTTRLVGNIIYVGAAGGFMEPLGITGQCPSLTSGVYAARYIALGDPSYERFAAKWDQKFQRFWRIRRTVNSWTDKQMDALVYAVSHGLGSLALHSPWSLYMPAGALLDVLRMANDPSTGVGPS